MWQRCSEKQRNLLKQAGAPILVCHRAIQKQATGALLGCYWLGLRKCHWISQIPYLFARLDEPGVAAECERQFSLSPLEAHHPLAIDLLHETGKLRKDFLLLLSHGTITENIRQVIELVSLLPFNDSVAETPHAKFSRLGRHSSASLWAWLAASMRFEKNLAYAEGVGEMIQKEWSRYTSVLQVHTNEKANRSKQISRSEFE